MSAYVGGTSSAGTGVLTYSPAAGNGLLVWSFNSVGNGDGTATLSDNGASGGSVYVRELSAGSITGSSFLTVWYVENCKSGVTTITAAYNGGGVPGLCEMGVMEFSGAGSFLGITAPNNQTNPGAGANAVISSALSISSVPAWLIGLSADTSANGGWSAGTSPIAFTLGPYHDAIASEYATVSSSGSVSATFGNTHGAAMSPGTVAIGIAQQSSGAVAPSRFFLGSSLLPLGALSWIIGRRNKLAAR